MLWRSPGLHEAWAGGLVGKSVGRNTKHRPYSWLLAAGCWPLAMRWVLGEDKGIGRVYWNEEGR